MQILMGADPEVFMRKDGQFVSAYGAIPGDKENPHRVNDGAVQVDGMALEFNIDPADSEECWTQNLHSVLAQLQELVPDHEVVAVPVAPFGAEYIAQQPDLARELGCDPDFNAWSGEENESPDEELPFRTGAGHVHIGWTEGADVHDRDHIASCESIIKQLDFFLGLPSLVYDGDTQRREMYGKAGAFRPKPYGAEYRTLSNAWLANDGLISWVYRASNEAVRQIIAGNKLFEKYGDIQEIINTSDVDAAMKIIKAEGLEVPYVG